MKYWIKSLITILILLVILLASNLLFGGKGEGTGFAFIAILYLSPIIILGFVFVSLLIRKSISVLANKETRKSSKNETNYSKIGFWIGTTFGVIILFIGILHFFAYSKDTKEFFDIILCTFIGFVIPTLIGIISEKLKRLENWKDWSSVKKGSLIGIISSLLIITLWIVYIIIEGGVFREGLGYLIKDQTGNIILVTSILFPIIISSLIGFFIGLSKDNN